MVRDAAEVSAPFGDFVAGDFSRYHSRELADIVGVMVHRIDVGETGEEVVHAFEQREDVGKYTGYKRPYTFLVGRDGKVEQLLPFNRVGPHALRQSKPYVSVACIGDFREHPPTYAQWTALVELCGDLLVMLGCSAACVRGHGEVAGASRFDKSPGSRDACPGDLLDADKLRGELASMDVSPRAC